MQAEFIEQIIVDLMRRHRKSLAEARDEAVRGLGLSDTSMVDKIVGGIRAEGRRNQLLDIPAGVEAESYRKAVTEDVKDAPWYVGPKPGDVYWPLLKEKLLSSPMADVVPEIDAASTKVVAHFADPGIRGLKKKGLVLGYVQSGKTANYTAVMAKAADAGYRTFIVLSGMHNNLRRQTQARINRDLGVDADKWASLTTEEADFGKVLHGAALMASGVHSIAVVKKNAARLRRLRDWLADIDEDVRGRSPILILDDEADQATPNSLAAREEISRINKLVREIWAEVVTGSYVGYTATPFANVFMDPEDDEDLYPSDFILDLPRSDAYFGAERIFGREPLDDTDSPDDGLDMVRSIHEDEVNLLRPPSKAEDRASFDPPLPESLKQATRWFFLATAVRWARGQAEAHSSMLVHTSAYVAPHFAMRARLMDLLSDIEDSLKDGDLDEFRTLYEDESPRNAYLNPLPLPSWDEVASLLPDVVATTRIVVDNSVSDDRLDYNRLEADGRRIPETVIAVGGSTLSRGLTLEGLTVSYFIRTSNTYDTLLQMGRWFGYRQGYGDLPRIWMSDELREDFMFLALVEEEIRRDMRRLEQMNVTPKQFGVRVRAHPGRLSITSKAKMVHADLVRVSYAGQRHQTIVLHEKNDSVLRANLDATRRLIEDCHSVCTFGVLEPARSQFFGLSVDRLISFLSQFTFHPEQPGLRADHIIGWLRSAAPSSRWNVVVRGTSRPLRTREGASVELGTVDLELPYEVPMVNRAPLKRPGPETGIANIKALLSQSDWLADVDPELVSDHGPLKKQDEYQARRRDLVGNDGLLIVYVISPNSVAVRETQEGARRSMTAEVPLVGLGLIFPEVEAAWSEGDASYYSVSPDWETTTDEEVEIPTDSEGFASVDGSELVADGTL